MFKRSLFALVTLLILFIPLALVYAQDAPDAIRLALADLSARVGRTVTLADLSVWRWTQSNYPDTSLGCPQPGQAYAQVLTNGYQFLLTYNGATYDYRVAANLSTVILCTPGAAQATATPVPLAATATPIPLLPLITPTFSRQVLCPGAMPSQLRVGIEVRARNNGIPKNIRSAPSTASAIIGQIPAGDTATILGGPQCGENFVWWQVGYQTLVGWAAEGDNELYWLEPLTAPTPTPLAATAVPTPGAPQVYDLPGKRPPLTSANVAQIARLVELPLNEQVTGVAWSPDGATLVAATPNGFYLYTTAAFTAPPRVIRLLNAPTYAAAFNPASGLLATAHGDGTVRLWDISTGGQRAVLRGHTRPVWALAFNPSGMLLASGGGDPDTGDDSAVRLWDVATGAQIAVLQGHSGAVTGLAFSPDGTLLASSSADRSVRLWDVVSATPATTLSGHTLPVRSVAFSPDGTLLVSGGDDGALRVWDIATGASTPLEGHAARVLALAFAPGQDALLASAGGALAGPGDNAIHVWDAATGQAIAAINATGAAPNAAVTSLIFSPDGTALVFVTVEGTTSTIRLWGVGATSAG